MRKHRLTIMVAVIGIVGFILLMSAPSANAHHGANGETYKQAVFRDKAAVVKCDRFSYRGHSPSKKWCKAILSAVHKVKEPGRKPNRSWVYNSSLLKLASHESSYSHNARNRTSGACGIGQMLPCDKYGPNSCWPNLYIQARCYIRYILRRYRTPERAWHFWQYVAPCYNNRACRGSNWY